MIVAAACRLRGGLVLVGARHWDSLMRAQLKACGGDIGGSSQGFVDEKGEFLTRSEAWVVASRCNQIVKRVGGDGVELYSENLY